MSKTRTIALKRISKDIQEITKNPVEGIGITQYENDFLKYIVNIKLMNGIYKGFCLQLLLTFSDSSHKTSKNINFSRAKFYWLLSSPCFF